MNRPRVVALSGVVLAAALALSFTCIRASAGQGPFYVVPASATNECTNVPHCSGVTGPWVVIPAGGEATYLLRCPERHGFAVGGTDARVSSHDVQVWFDGQLGAPIGVPSHKTTTGAAVLFHATSGDGKAAWFQPTVGCSSLAESTQRSTVSALPGVTAGPPLDVHAASLQVGNELPYLQRQTCPRGETIASWWVAFAFIGGPPVLSLAEHLFTMKHAIVAKHRSLLVGIRTSANVDAAAGPYPHVFQMQVGIQCHVRSKS